MIPRFNEDDVARFESVLQELLATSEASVALILERAGYLIHQCGAMDGVDTTGVAALASNAFAATEFMTKLIQEPDFSGMYQQGSAISTLTLSIDPSCLLFVVFPSCLSAGAVKYFAIQAVRQLAEQLTAARERVPGEEFDLATLNPADARELFQKEKPE